MQNSAFKYIYETVDICKDYISSCQRWIHILFSKKGVRTTIRFMMNPRSPLNQTHVIVTQCIRPLSPDQTRPTPRPDSYTRGNNWPWATRNKCNRGMKFISRFWGSPQKPHARFWVLKRSTHVDGGLTNNALSNFYKFFVAL